MTIPQELDHAEAYLEQAMMDFTDALDNGALDLSFWHNEAERQIANIEALRSELPTIIEGRPDAEELESFYTNLGQRAYNFLRYIQATI